MDGFWGEVWVGRGRGSVVGLVVAVSCACGAMGRGGGAYVDVARAGGDARGLGLVAGEELLKVKACAR